MAIVQSSGALALALRDDLPAPAVTRSTGLYSMAPSTYAAIYRTQPNVRTVVDFLARNIAQIGLHVFRRVSDTDRVRLANHELVQWMERPNYATCRYRLMEMLVQDLGIYFNAYWLKLRGEDAVGLLRLPPETVAVEGWLLPTAYIWTRQDGREFRFRPRDLVVFNGYDPLDPLLGLSPLETLRQILAENCASTAYRASYWQNAARIEGVVERPLQAPRWTSDQKQAWREQWQSRFVGPGKAGQVPVLEDGMTFRPTAYSARDSEFSTVRKLTREEVAAAYHVPLPMVGILDHATFSNIREQHKNLYQDCLGPWLVWLQEEIERQLLIESDDTENVYCEFNIAEKMKGSFEEQGAALQQLCGRPIMTGNEGRARLNLTSIKDDPSMNEVVLALNTSAPSDAPPAATEPREASLSTEASAPIIRRHWMRQRARLDQLPPEARAEAFDVARWTRELAEDLEPLYLAAGCSHAVSAESSITLAETINADTLQLLVKGDEAFSAAREAGLYV